MRKLSEAAMEDDELTIECSIVCGESIRFYGSGAMQVNEQAYESLPQRGSGRGRKGAVAELGSTQRSPDVLAELGDRLGSTMNHLELQGSAETPAAVCRTLYRKDAEGDACYECEDMQHQFALTSNVRTAGVTLPSEPSM